MAYPRDMSSEISTLTTYADTATIIQCQNIDPIVGWELAVYHMPYLGSRIIRKDIYDDIMI